MASITRGADAAQAILRQSAGRWRGVVTTIEIITGMIRLALQRDHQGHVVLILVRGNQWHVLARSSYPCNHHPTLWRRWQRERARLVG